MDAFPADIEDPSSPLWDLESLLNFTLDDQFPIPVASSGYDHDSAPAPLNIQSPEMILPEMGVSASDRVRKRDPRLTCSNFLAGRVPCACPEMDAALAEEEAAGSGKKRARKVNAAVIAIRCQVPGCEVDISELKGYHRRHRICLRCASTSSVVIDGDSKRYCQQCGKFHVLADFDKDRRSCRRKLERHNNRRRRKPSDHMVAVENEIQRGVTTEEVLGDDQAGKDGICLSSRIFEKEALVNSKDGHVSTFCSDPDSQNNRSNSLSLVASDEGQIDGGKDNYNCSISPSYFDNKSSYMPVCPTGRISFKLFDWNPAEFPRRLRHQIFEWLANMPVELEGYIRPGCTILTIFVAMPNLMWEKLLEDPVLYLHGFLFAPGNMLFERGNLLVYVNNMVFRVARGGTSVMKVKVEVQAPRLQYVHPTCFEAGKPMEFFACGSNLLQPKFRFLVSFSGKYLTCDYHAVSSHDKTEGDSTCSSDHQFYKICVPQTEPNVLGPAFIEVENESGLSNFIPVLIGDKEICSEMKTMQQIFDAFLFSQGPQVSDSHEASALRRTTFSEFILDVAWLLKQPASESWQRIMTSTQIQKFNCLLLFLIQNKSNTILERILDNLTILINNMESSTAMNCISNSAIWQLRERMDCANTFLRPRLQKSQSLLVQSVNAMPKSFGSVQSCSQDEMLAVIPVTNQDIDIRAYGNLDSGSLCIESETVSLLKEVVMNVHAIKELPKQSCRFNFSSTIMRLRSTMLVICTVVICFGICAAIFHPDKVNQFSVSIRRCLSGKIQM